MSHGRYGNGVQVSHDLLVANFKPGQFDANGNPIKDRTAWQHNIVFDRQGRGYNVGLQGGISASTATVTVADNDFAAEAILLLGDFKLRSNLEWAEGGSAAASATALAAAINNLPGFSASPSGADVDITGPGGVAGVGVQLKALYRGAVINFTLSPATGTLTPGGPVISGPTSIP